jgi:hypothetical protein
MAFAMLMRRMNAGAFTEHGFSSAFRDWAGDETQFPREVAEQALAHRVGDATERAYRALYLRRRRLGQQHPGQLGPECMYPATANPQR